MAHAALRAWVRSEKGACTEGLPAADGKTPRHLVFTTASFLALYPIAGYAPYNPSKAALRTLSDQLSQEMNLYAAANPQARAVKVHTIFPATIYTDSYEAENKIKSDITKMLEEADGGQTLGQVAQGSMRGLERGHELITTDWMTRAVMCSTLGASIRGGFWKGLTDWLLGSLILLVMVFVRIDMDREVRSWGEAPWAHWNEEGLKFAQSQKRLWRLMALLLEGFIPPWLTIIQR